MGTVVLPRVLARGQVAITLSEERVILCFIKLMVASVELMICLVCNQYFVGTANFKQE